MAAELTSVRPGQRELHQAARPASGDLTVSRGGPRATGNTTPGDDSVSDDSMTSVEQLS